MPYTFKLAYLFKWSNAIFFLWQASKRVITAVLQQKRNITAKLQFFLLSSNETLAFEITNSHVKITLPKFRYFTLYKSHSLLIWTFRLRLLNTSHKPNTGNFFLVWSARPPTTITWMAIPKVVCKMVLGNFRSLRLKLIASVRTLALSSSLKCGSLNSTKRKNRARFWAMEYFLGISSSIYSFRKVILHKKRPVKARSSWNSSSISE